MNKHQTRNVNETQRSKMSRG